MKNDIIDLQTSHTDKEFVIYSCGKHGNESKRLTKKEAQILYIELHKFLNK